MRELGHRATELLVERIEGLPKEHAWEGDFQQILADQLMEDPPEHGQPAEKVLERAAHNILPVAARNDHPRFFAFTPSSPTWPGVLADFLTAGHQVNQCTWLTSSGPSQLELVVLEWIRRWIGYPASAGGLLTSGGSAASVDAFVAAREAAGYPERATVYMSDQSHSAQVRAARIIGIRPECIRKVASDERFSPGRGGARPHRGRRPGRRVHPHRGVCQRRSGEYGGHRSVGSHRGLLRGGTPLAARRRGIRRLRHRDRAGPAALAGNRARRFHRVGRAQVVLPAVRGGRSPGEGQTHARTRLPRTA